MKIKIITTIEVDQQAWADEYGMNRKDVRDDASSYIYNQISELPVLNNGIAKIVDY